MKKLLAFTALALLTLVAAKPVPVESSIVIDYDRSILQYQQSVYFDYTVEKLAGTQYPLIYVSCYQDGAKVYGSLQHPYEGFVLGGGSSRWIVNGGGAAECEAYLAAYGGKGKTPYAVILAGPILFTAVA